MERPWCSTWTFDGHRQKNKAHTTSLCTQALGDMITSCWFASWPVSSVLVGFKNIEHLAKHANSMQSVLCDCWLKSWYGLHFILLVGAFLKNKLIFSLLEAQKGREESLTSLVHYQKNRRRVWNCVWLQSYGSAAGQGLRLSSRTRFYGQNGRTGVL